MRCLLGMGKVPLDLGTADRMLAGEVDSADVPPGFEAVAELLVAVRAAARRPVFATVLGPAVVDSRQAAGRPRGRRRMLATTPFKPRLSILAAAVALSAMTGAACAAGLPGAASAKADAVLKELGIATPGSPSHTRSSRPQTHGSTVSQTATTTTAGADKGALIAGIASGGKSRAGGSAATGRAKATPGHGKGAEISTLAHTTTATGAAKGATISAAASGGKSHAGQHGHQGHHGHTPAGAGHGQGGNHSHG